MIVSALPWMLKGDVSVELSLICGIKMGVRSILRLSRSLFICSFSLLVESLLRLDNLEIRARLEALGEVLVLKVLVSTSLFREDAVFDWINSISCSSFSLE